MHCRQSRPRSGHAAASSFSKHIRYQRAQGQGKWQVSEASPTCPWHGGLRGSAVLLRHSPYPLIPEALIPSMNRFCARKKTTMTGTIITVVSAITRFQGVTWVPAPPMITPALAMK